MDNKQKSIFQAERFKEKSLILFDIVNNELQQLEKPLFPPFIISLIRSMINNKNSDEIIHNFVEETHNDWQNIKERNEGKLIETLPNAFISRDNVPQFVNANIEIFINFIKNRKDFVSDTFDDDIWEVLDEMIKHSILYIHFRRNPDPKYQSEYFPAISVKKNLEMWDIKL